jgi:hypothetical protein
MLIGEDEIALLARAMIDRHGPKAARRAAIRLNQMIDRRDWRGRDNWACVVRAIHQNLAAAGTAERIGCAAVSDAA